jgi:hypothetical protein
MIIAFGGMIGAILLFPIANLVIRTGDLSTIAWVVYVEMALFNIIGGIILAFRQSDSAYGIGTGVLVAAAVLMAVYFSYNLPAQSHYDLGGNPHYTHFIGIPLSLGCCWIGYLVTYYIRKRRLARLAG